MSKPVLSIGRLNLVGFTVLLALDGAFLSKGDRRVPLRRDNDVFFLDAKVLQAASSAGGKLICSNETGGTSSSADGAQPPRLGSADMDDSHAARGPTTTVVPASEERERHALCHLPFRNWCRICVCGRAKDEARGLPLLQAVFSFLGSQGDAVTATGITLVDTGSCRAGATGIPLKAKAVYVVQFVCHMISEWGYTDTVVQSDQEPAITSVVEAVQRLRPHRTLLRKSPRYSHASLGSAEQGNWAVEAMVRTLSEHVRERYGEPIAPRGVVMAWAIRHAAWLLTR